QLRRDTSQHFHTELITAASVRNSKKGACRPVRQDPVCRSSLRGGTGRQNFLNASSVTAVRERTAMRNIAKLALACACVAVPSVAHAAGGDSGGFGISLTIPEVCQIDASAIVHDGSGLTSASVFEMCNSSHGFRVFASHR